jgi:hypothetical protein
MASIWLTYAWVDNEAKDIDFVVQELRREGLTVKLDREQIIVGRRLWDQIASYITDPNGCDAWGFVISRRSLESEACREELAYAIDRAISKRGKDFPLIGILFEQVDRELIPAAIRTRLYVTLSDQNWAKRVATGVVGLPPGERQLSIEPFELTRYTIPNGVIIELRPRAGTWYPCIAMVPITQEYLLVDVFVSPSGGIPTIRTAIGARSGRDKRGCCSRG